ncbi:unnamed protein product [Linum trigynum]|uniref:Uncharacterized protein n=1 Tax=Linum trigynum TaxID=586398 RepID=A0AAV2CCD3_9ROSI
MDWSSKSPRNFFNEIILNLHAHARLFTTRDVTGKGVVGYSRTFLIIIITGALRDSFRLLHNVFLALFILLIFL